MQVAARAGALSAAERSYPTSKVRGSSLECQAVMVQERMRGVTPHPRSGADAERSYPASEARGGGWEEQRHTEARDGGQEEQPHVQGAVTMQVQEGLEEPSHIEGQEGQQ